MGITGAAYYGGTTSYRLLYDFLHRHAMTEGAPCPAPVLQLLGAMIRHYRQQRGLTQQALAHQAALSTNYLREIEKGRRNVSVLNLLRLADALHFPTSVLLQPLEAHPELYALGRT